MLSNIYFFGRQEDGSPNDEGCSGRGQTRDSPFVRLGARNGAGDEDALFFRLYLLRRRGFCADM